MNERYNSHPFAWDRPGIGLYSAGMIRILKDGGKTSVASDAEVLKVMEFERLDKVIELLERQNTLLHEIYLQQLAVRSS